MPCRLHVPGKILGFRRGKHTQHPNISLLEVQGCTSTHGARYYLGKTVYYIYKVKKCKSNKKGIKVIRGKIVKTHGNSGVVRARFTHNIPPKAFGASVRVMLYPQH
ncbi:putative 60S ribosomal protein L35Ae [Monocercomonoides exilis]|uniref:putative 60S ribosomal protein L35Ae n=1 Tax=Monocercomonoides exilis TaxID=2049356 RepID=UPI003559AFEC|nr:putative 60S ribosomal protein L35Ae [Monocercomonoides exilis]|eukprot:MONOS_16799.1-p1 / transcript=MONOS_16799.1 / gene=MONOS_16799 / organism=Monocercomonoides_exilis_PA203 / gene_product=60S ribosomal protein L35Ae / transcript_product=60S ribosomal protein L35Ae / location=Mono_scaffold00220:57853-58310(+) / protein_length=106 / sequence_SO=supercontig / SO=protein_coding / is_pseudo=false